jgi:hypothetical protein
MVMVIISSQKCTIIPSLFVQTKTSMFGVLSIVGGVKIDLSHAHGSRGSHKINKNTSKIIFFYFVIENRKMIIDTIRACNKFYRMINM